MEQAALSLYQQDLRCQNSIFFFFLLDLPESMVSVWVSGFGNVGNVPVAIVTFQLPLFPSLEVPYAGQAPDFVTGLYQINSGCRPPVQLCPGWDSCFRWATL